MTRAEFIRKDSVGHIISKNNKNYHISFNQKIDIIEIKSYKMLNMLTDNNGFNNLFFDSKGDKYDETGDEIPKKKSFIESNKRIRIRKYSNKNPNALKNIKCNIF